MPQKQTLNHPGVKIKMSKVTDPIEAYVDSVMSDVVDVVYQLDSTVIESEQSIMGLSPEREEEVFFTLFFD